MTYDGMLDSANTFVPFLMVVGGMCLAVLMVIVLGLIG
jgi:hypothetical protein